jgi:RNA-binding protein
MDIKKIKELREKSRLLNPAIRIGKLGLTEGLVKEINAQLKKKKLLKIRILRPALDEMTKEELRDKVIEKTGAILVNHIGLVITLYYQKREEQ